jgi:small-conductance mechanosensitive channel
MIGPSLREEGWFLWGIVLVVGFPLLVVILGEAGRQLARRGSPIAKPVRLLRNFVLPATVVALFLRYVLVRRGNTIDMRLSATFAWICAIVVSLSLFSAFLFGSKRGNSWRARAPRLFVDIIRLSLVALGGAIVVSTIWGVNLGALVAALGVGSIAIGLALQDTLASLMGGITILSENNFTLEDWVEVEGHKGRVVDIDWRTVKLLTSQQDIVIVPNIVFGKSIVRNNSRPDRSHTSTIVMGFSYDDPPSRVHSMLRDVAQATPGVVPNSIPVIHTLAYGKTTIDYEVEIQVEEFGIVGDVLSEVMTRIWYAARRDGLTIGGRTNVNPEAMNAVDQSERAKQQGRFVENLSLPVVEMEELFSQASLRHFAAGELIVREGGAIDGLGLLLTGQAMVSVQRPDGADLDVYPIADGEFFGEEVAHGLTRAIRSIRAVSDVEVVVLRRDIVLSLIERNSRFGSAIERVIAARRLETDRCLRSASSSPVRSA